MNDGKDISFTCRALAETPRDDLDDLNRMLGENLGLVSAVRKETAREPLVTAIGELEKAIQGLSARVQAMEAKVELAKRCL